MKHFIVLSALALTATTMTAQKRIYPNAPKDGTVDTYFGVKIPDPFRPLEADRSKETAEWVAAENKITNEYLAKIPFRGKFLKRLKEVADYEKVGAPFKKNGKWYVFKNNGLQNQSVLYQMDELGGALYEFLDPNKLSTDGTVALQGISFSKDGRYMAYVISRSGSDWQEIYVKDVATGELLSDHIEWAKFGGAQWCGNGFYYSAYDAPEKGKEYSSKNEVHKVYYHKIGTPQGQDALLFGIAEQGRDHDVPPRKRCRLGNEPVRARPSCARCTVHTDDFQHGFAVQPHRNRRRQHLLAYQRRGTTGQGNGCRHT